ncbi:MAG: protein kinase [Candidatus Eisenbacteria bacterium]
MRLSPGTHLGPYEIITPLGAGGMGEVYRARDARLGRDVAIKVLPAAAVPDPEHLRRFEREVRAAGGLHHPNILAIYDVGTQDGAPYMVSELLEGETLGRRLAAGALPLKKAMDYALQIGAGLAAAHAHGIIHRDLKPDNVFVTREGHVKILDFGLARLIEPESETPDAGDTRSMSLTETGTVMGSAGYMAPEQVRGERVDARADLFTYGCILYEMLSGKRAFAGDTPVAMIYAILNQEPQPLAELRPDLPSALGEIVGHCLDKDPAHRFQSALDATFALTALSGSAGVLNAPSVAARGARRLTWSRTLGAAALLIAGVGIGVLAHTRLARAPLLDLQRLTFRRGFVSAARFVPGMHSVVYSAAWQGGPLELFVIERGQRESRSLGLPGSELLAVSRSGELAIRLPSGTLARVPLAGGAPREMVEHVGEADWAPDGEHLAVTLTSHEYRTEAVLALNWRVEYPVGTMLYESPTWISEPRVSPDGSRVAFIDHSLPGDTGGSIAAVGRDGKKRTLSPWFSRIRGVAWTPRGDEIWYSSAGVGEATAVRAVSLTGIERVVYRTTGGLTLHDIASDGDVLSTRSDVRQEIHGVVAGEVRERDYSLSDLMSVVDLSNDGTTLLLADQGETAESEYTAYLQKTDGSHAVRLFEGLGTSLSADGKWVLSLPVDRKPPLTMQPTGPGAPRALERGPIATYDWAAWFPDGRRIVCSGTEKGQPSRCYLQDLEGGPPRPLTPPGTSLFNPGAAVSPDGKYVVARHESGKISLYPVNGGAAREVPGINGGEEYAIRWSADGQTLFVARGGRVFRVDPFTGARQLWKTIAPADSAGIRSFLTLQITPDGRNLFYTTSRELSDLYRITGLR